MMYGMVFLLCLMCGCSGKTEEKTEENELSAYDEQITVKDIKQKYNYSDDSIMPLYNVALDEEFDFFFPYDLSENDTEEENYMEENHGVR